MRDSSPAKVSTKDNKKTFSLNLKVAGSRVGIQVATNQIMDIDDEDSSDELHIDEGQNYKPSNRLANSRGIRNAYSSNAGAYNSALLSFGGRGNAANTNPLLGPRNTSSRVPKPISNNRNATDHTRNAVNSKQFDNKDLGNARYEQSEHYRATKIGTTTAEGNFSSSFFYSENINNMAVPNSLNSFGIENRDEHLYQGMQATLNNGVRNR